MNSAGSGEDAGADAGTQAGSGSNSCTDNDELFDGNAPNLGSPWEIKNGVHVTNSGTPQPWRALYDAFGRLVARTDYNAPNPSIGAARIHYHVYVWDPKSLTPREVEAHIDGEAPYLRPGDDC